jgi:glycolate oxidase iron-sulfur subunit
MPTPRTAGELAFSGDDLYPKTLDCVHCGLCLSACPTYRETGREASSPRGRVYLMRGVAEGRIPLGEVVVEEAYLCLGCRACETACPSGVRFGALLERTRAEIERAGLRRGLAKRIEAWALTKLVPRPRRLAALVSALGIAQRLRLDRLALALLPERLREVHAQLPPIPPRRERRKLPERIPHEGERRGRVQLFVGCVMPELFGAVNAATARVLARNGFEVLVPRGQGCCGALQAHAGLEECARELARANAACFAHQEADALIVNSAGCGASMREAVAGLGATGAAYAASVRDVAEFLDEVGLRAPSGRIAARVCYDDPCHLVHGQGVREAPRRLLEQIPGVELVPHDDPTGCCGAAGIYNLTHPQMARSLLEHKVAALRAADPDLIATGNPGCLLQISSGAARAQLRARVVHPIELLDESYRIGG